MNSARNRTWRGLLLAAFTVVAFTGVAAAAMGQLAERPVIGVLTHPAIEYNTRPVHNPVSDLVRNLDEGRARLTFDADTGYLRSMLDALHVPVESQMLVMSKTGIQGLYTGPQNPRAIFFNDDVTVGYIRGAPLLELAVHDPEQGVVFYTLDQKPQGRPLVDRRSGCFTCHHVYSTLHVPGLLARSVVIGPEGLGAGQYGTYDADDRTPFRRRWGGWYVTGTHGSMEHLGNAILTNPNARDTMISDRTLNRTSVADAFDTHGYVSAHSDIVALMVFQHQVRMTNLITRVGWDTRIAASEHRVDFARGPLRDAVEELVDYLLFVDEQPLTAAIKGTSGFAELFAKQGPDDHQGRSLRQLDLEHRLLRYPCSYLIYSPAFRALPADARRAIYTRVFDILSGRESAAKYARLSADDRKAVAEILRDTVPDLPRDLPATDRNP